ncbi:chromo domain protein LHP1 [Cicer arietinum]|uniref:Chromo domain protein LHP1 n=1 Tax=Cicer arietinum TaxID=3827 RepID=A0A1S2Y8M2_CICAR|nr:chromo domain protein LHP1 [Cicer arietinum]
MSKESEVCRKLQNENENETPSTPKLDDGFYEIETIRRKRLRKGEVQYLIKWRGWPETANTWEPLQNLQSVPDLIHAFEDSLKSGKHRKRKRTTHLLPNPFPPLPNHTPQLQPSTTLPTHSQTNTALGNSNILNTTSQHIAQTNQENDFDLKLNQLKPTPNTADNLAIHFQQPNAHLESQSKGDSIQSDRCRGAKRRKTGSVKRFKKEESACESLDTKNAIGISVTALQQGLSENAGYLGNNTHQKIDDTKTACNIVKILKPIGYSASLSCYMQDVRVTFMAMRSDGTEVMVDNKYLKTYNPLLLINFYEQHLRYNPTS